jgi:hypothetical protein
MHISQSVVFGFEFLGSDGVTLRAMRKILPEFINADSSDPLVTAGALLREQPEDEEEEDEDDEEESDDDDDHDGYSE